MITYKWVVYTTRWFAKKICFVASAWHCAFVNVHVVGRGVNAKVCCGRDCIKLHIFNVLPLCVSLCWYCLVMHGCVCLCALGIRKSIRPVKIDWWGVGVVVWSEVQIVSVWSSWCHCHPRTTSSLASFKTTLVLPSVADLPRLSWRRVC